MNLVFRPMRGNLVFRPQGRARWYPEATTHPAMVQVWWRLINEDGSRPPFQLLGTYPVGHQLQMPYNPDLGKDVEVSTISISAAGVPSVSHPDDGVRATVLVRRDTDPPLIGQLGTSTTEEMTLGITGFSRFARKRKVRVADNALMTSASVLIFDSDDYIDKELPRYIVLSRTAVLVPDFTWAGDDPATHGFTKTGSSTTSASTSPLGWKITTTGSDLKTYYSKDSFPSTPFDDGFTLDVVPPPAILATDAGAPSMNAGIYVADSIYGYSLAFDADEVSLNGGTAYVHGGGRVRLVIAPGGATADLWVADVKVEDDSAADSLLGSPAAVLKFGDLDDADDSETVWRKIEYAFTPQDPALAETIYVGVAHSSGAAFGPESDIGEFSFASELGGSGGSSGDFDPTPIDRWEDPLI